MKSRYKALAGLFLVFASSSQAQFSPPSSLQEMAATPVVKLSITETLRTPPDEATLTIGTQATALTATAAVAANKLKTERQLSAIRAQQIRERDIQTQGIRLQRQTRWDQVAGRTGREIFTGYLASNSIQIKTRDIPALTGLIDTLTAAGADTIYGPTFGIADRAPLRRDARRRALERGETEALEYARHQGFTRVRLLSVEEGTSYQGTDIVVSASRIGSLATAPPAPPPPPAPRSGIVAPGQLEVGVSLALVYRMER